MMLQFERIYLDTEPLTRSQWPRVSTSLENAFKLSRLFKVALFVPKPVLDERESQWFRGLEKKERTLQTARTNLSRHCRGLGEAPDLGKWDREEIRQTYAARVNENLERYGITVVETTSRSAEELYPLALKGTAPFGEKGTGFKDAVILFSIVDHLLAHPVTDTAALLTMDGDFRGVDLEKIDSRLGTTVISCYSVDQIVDEFRSALAETVGSAWEVDRENARVALEAESDSIAGFISGTVQFSEFDTGGFGRILEIVNLRVRLIRDVQTPYLVDRPGGEPVTFSATVEAGVDVFEEHYPSRPPLLVRIGEPAEKTIGKTQALIPPIPFPTVERREIIKVFELDCRADVRNGIYENLELLGVRRSQDELSVYELKKSLEQYMTSIAPGAEDDE